MADLNSTYGLGSSFGSAAKTPIDGKEMIPASVLAFLVDSGWVEQGGRLISPSKYTELQNSRFGVVSWNTALAYEVFQRMTLGSYNNE